MTAKKTAASSRPMDIINDVTCIIYSARGVADLLACVSADQLDQETVQHVGYALRDMMIKAEDRLSSAEWGAD